MKICFVWHCPYPWDVRLEKLINAVLEEGHSVCVLCKGKKGLARDEKLGPITIRRVEPAALPIPRALRAASNYPLFFNPVWVREFRTVMRRESPDVLVVRDLPLALLGSRIGREFGKPVIFDMAENYPAALLSYQNKAYRPLLVGNAWLPRKYESISVSKVDRVLVVADEQRQRLIAAGVDHGKLKLVGNTPTSSFVKEGLCGSSIADSPEPNLLYVGFVDPHRGVDVAIRAMPKLLNRSPQLTLTVVGDGTARSGLMRLAQQLGLEQSVSFVGWAPFEELPAYIRRSTVCLIPHRESEHTNTTLPNKLFEYMSFGKPVLASSCRPMQRIIEAENCGLVFKSGDTESFIRSAEALLSHPLRERIGSNGQRAVQKIYNWSNDSAAFLDTLTELAGGFDAENTAQLSAVHHHR